MRKIIKIITPRHKAPLILHNLYLMRLSSSSSTVWIDMELGGSTVNAYRQIYLHNNIRRTHDYEKETVTLCLSGNGSHFCMTVVGDEFLCLSLCVCLNETINEKVWGSGNKKGNKTEISLLFLRFNNKIKEKKWNYRFSELLISNKKMFAFSFAVFLFLCSIAKTLSLK